MPSLQQKGYKMLEPTRTNRDIREDLTDFYSIFPEIKQYANRLILNGNVKSINYAKKPMVNVKGIAAELGIRSIIKVPDKLIHGKHALLFYFKEKPPIIFLNMDDDPEERLFSIAHEIFHYILIKEHTKQMRITYEKIRRWTEQLKSKNMNPSITENQTNEFKENISSVVAARENTTTIKEILRKTSLDRETFIKFLTNALKKEIEAIVEDEVADYFAANLIIPVERFILWQYKEEAEIARAFRVVEKCVQKRQMEIKHELEIMAPKSFSSGINLDEVTPKDSLLNHTPRGISVHDTERI